MISDLETGLKNYLAAELTADATLSGVTYEVRQSTDKDPLAKDRISVVVSMQGAPRTITKLSEGMGEIVVAAPMNVAGVTVADLKKLETSVEKAFNAAVNTDAVSTLNSAITAAMSGWTGAGYFAEGWQQGREETGFLPVFRVKVGAVRD